MSLVCYDRNAQMPLSQADRELLDSSVSLLTGRFTCQCSGHPDVDILFCSTGRLKRVDGAQIGKWHLRKNDVYAVLLVQMNESAAFSLVQIPAGDWRGHCLTNDRMHMAFHRREGPTADEEHMVTAAISRFKLFGLQRTGTNLMQHALVSNYAVRSMEKNREWKHGFIRRSAREGISLVICFRNPHSWLDAMYRFSIRGRDRDGCPHFQSDWTFSDFCRNPHHHWPTPIDRWNCMNAFYSAWLRNHPNQGVSVRSEDLLSLAGQEKEFSRVGDTFKWERKSGTWSTFNRRIQHAGARQGAPMNRGYYTTSQYLSAYSAELLAEVNSRINAAVCQELAYSLPSA